MKAAQRGHLAQRFVGMAASRSARFGGAVVPASGSATDDLLHPRPRGRAALVLGVRLVVLAQLGQESLGELGLAPFSVGDAVEQPVLRIGEEGGGEVEAVEP